MASNLTSKKGILEFVGSPIEVLSAETIRPSFDFAPVMADNEVIHSASLAVYTVPNLLDVSSTILNGSPSLVGTTVIQGLKNFSEDTTYMIVVKVVIYLSGAPAGKELEQYCTVHSM